MSSVPVRKRPGADPRESACALGRGQASVPLASRLPAGPDSDSPRAAPIMPAMKKPRDVIQPRWGVYALRKRAEKCGSVEVRDQKDALDRAGGECMSEAAEYRRDAQVCVEDADTAPSEGDRKALLGLAQHWLQRASDAEGRTLATADGSLRELAEECAAPSVEHFKRLTHAKPGSTGNSVPAISRSPPLIGGHGDGASSYSGGRASCHPARGEVAGPSRSFRWSHLRALPPPTPGGRRRCASPLTAALTNRREPKLVPKARGRANGHAVGSNSSSYSDLVRRRTRLTSAIMAPSRGLAEPRAGVRSLMGTPIRPRRTHVPRSSP
jgi:hypothetical protein